MNRLFGELDKIRVFVAVAEKCKINEAATALNLTQPSVTRSIQKLEEAFGATLFVRSRNGVKLTTAGKLLFNESTKILKRLSEVQAQAKADGKEISGILNIGTFESLAEYLWPDFLGGLEKSHPQLSLSINTGKRNDPVLDLLSGAIDLIVDAEPQTKSSVISWPIYSDRFSFYCAAKYPRIEFNQDWAKTANVSFVSGAFDENRVSIEAHLEQNGYEFSRQYRFDSFSTAKRIAIKAYGIAVLPQRLAKDDIDLGLIRKIDLKDFSVQGFGRHSIYATTRSENRNDARIKKVVTLLRSHFK